MRGTDILAVLAFCLPAAGGTVVADTARVDQALSGVGGLEGQIFTPETMKEVVVPYRENPAERDLKPERFEEEIEEIRQGDTSTGRMLRATEDSVASRPVIEIDGQGPLFDDANAAHENAGKIFGHIFQSQDPTCTPVGLPVSRIIDQFCETSPRRKTKTCDLIRKIWVDRTDTYRCDRRAKDYIKVCNRRTSYSCHQRKPFATCLKNNIRVGNAKESWDGTTLVIDVPPLPASSAERSGYLRKTNVTIALSDHVRLSEARLSRVEANGAIQVIAEGTILGTWGGTAKGSFGGAGAWCPTSDTSAKLVAATVENSCNIVGKPWRTAMAVLSNGDLSAESNFTQATGSSPDWEIGDGPSPYEMIEAEGRWETSGGDEASEPVFRCRPHSPNPHASCHLFSDVTDSGYAGRNVLRFLSLTQVPSLNPEEAKTWAETPLQIRVAYDNATSGASSRLRIDLQGECCDSFDREDREECK
ncbi:hypothetical protein [Chachezhania sediminis]|uniref:hypothetical protein n=1 Tax=Chachezhania sediminis TaxID=2599291 RepID=UPI00131BA837|nr:hypothetical protein [Chachezhania sediminis]